MLNDSFTGKCDYGDEATVLGNLSPPLRDYLVARLSSTRPQIARMRSDPRTLGYTVSSGHASI